jgi:hypothetical protein
MSSNTLNIYDSYGNLARVYHPTSPHDVVIIQPHETKEIYGVHQELKISMLKPEFVVDENKFYVCNFQMYTGPHCIMDNGTRSYDKGTKVPQDQGKRIFWI